jgi:DNA polymerase-3 subunit gamma/tau
MEPFIVSARKYRPKTFEEVVGQQAITKTLENAIKQNHLAQALLFTGPRGVGKTTCARILAKNINQQDSNTPGEEDFSFNIFELDAASNNSVDDIRSLTDQVRIPPQTGNYKVYIIDEVHMLSSAAFNAFLKTLEEPPSHAIFILATTEKHKIIPTILSRCQIYDFKRISVLDAKNYLKTIAESEGIQAEDDALHIIAQKADGAMRDALSIFDRVVSFSGKNLTREAVTSNLNVLDYEAYFKSTDLALENNIPELLLHFDSILEKGFDAHHFVIGFGAHLRDLLVAKDKQTIELLQVGDRTKKQYLEQSAKSEMSFLIAAIEKLNRCDLDFKSSKNQRLLVELCLMQLASITFPTEKKKSPNFIIPPSFFNKKSYSKPSSTPLPAAPKVAVKETVKRKIKLIDPSERRVSAFSLKNLDQSKEIEIEEEKEDFTNMPKTPFKQEELSVLWNKYIEDLKEDGQKSLASVLAANHPVAQGSKLNLELPNDLMKNQLEKGSHPLMTFLRTSLNNYDIKLHISVKETIQKKFIYTPEEKYQKMQETNPQLKSLRQRFKLDL